MSSCYKFQKGSANAGSDQVFVAWSPRCSIAFTVLSKIIQNFHTRLSVPHIPNICCRKNSKSAEARQTSTRVDDLPDARVLDIKVAAMRPISQVAESGRRLPSGVPRMSCQFLRVRAITQLQFGSLIANGLTTSFANPPYGARSASPGYNLALSPLNRLTSSVFWHRACQ